MAGRYYNQSNSRPPDRQDGRSYAAAAKNKECFKLYHDNVQVAKKTRNKIEIKFSRNDNDRNQDGKYIEMSTVANYIFDNLEVEPEDIKAIDLTNGNNGVKVITLNHT